MRNVRLKKKFFQLKILYIDCSSKIIQDIKKPDKTKKKSNPKNPGFEWLLINNNKGELLSDWFFSTKICEQKTIKNAQNRSASKRLKYFFLSASKFNKIIGYKLHCFMVSLQFNFKYSVAVDSIFVQIQKKV